MTAKFEAFKEALHALCVGHGVYLRSGYDYDDSSIYAEDASDSQPAGVAFYLEEVIAPTPEEIAAEEARRAAAQAEWNAKWADKWDGSYMKHHFALLDSMSLEEKQAMIAANAEEQRKKNMRVTRIPGDFHDIGDRPCRVWCNEQEITDWTVADDFRRVVETPGGVHHGAVRIDLAPVAEQTGLERCRAVFDFKLPDDCRLNIPDAERAALAEGCTAGMPICEEAVNPENITLTWSNKTQICDEPVKPKLKHIPARKRKAGK